MEYSLRNCHFFLVRFRLVRTAQAVGYRRRRWYIRYVCIFIFCLTVNEHFVIYLGWRWRREAVLATNSIWCAVGLPIICIPHRARGLLPRRPNVLPFIYSPATRKPNIIKITPV